MHCRDCGAECANIGALAKHKSECPGRPAAESNQTEGGGERPTPGFIPAHQLPDQWQVLGGGQAVKLAVLGRITKDGVVVDSAEWWRGR